MCRAGVATVIHVSRGSRSGPLPGCMAGVQLKAAMEEACRAFTVMEALILVSLSCMTCILCGGSQACTRANLQYRQDWAKSGGRREARIALDGEELEGWVWVSVITLWFGDLV